jgi:hypothetical protein
VDAWASQDRALALKDASPVAVNTLFAYSYPVGGLDFRGCSTPPPGTPAECSFRYAEDLLEFAVVPLASGWAVTRVALES